MNKKEEGGRKREKQQSGRVKIRKKTKYIY